METLYAEAINYVPSAITVVKNLLYLKLLLTAIRDRYRDKYINVHIADSSKNYIGYFTIIVKFKGGK